MTKRADAEVRKLLFEKLGPLAEDAKSLHTSLAKLRNGDLDYLSQLEALGDKAKSLSKSLKKVGEAVTSDAA